MWFSNTVPDWLHEIVPSRNRWQWCGSSWWAMHAPTSFSVWDWHPRGVCPVILAPRTTVKGHGMAAKLPSSSTHSLAPLASKGSTDQRLFEACKSWFRYNCGCVGSSSHQHWFLRRWFLRMWPNWTFLRLRQRANYYKGWSTLVPIVFKIIVKWCLKHQISYNFEAFFYDFFHDFFWGKRGKYNLSFCEKILKTPSSVQNFHEFKKLNVTYDCWCHLLELSSRKHLLGAFVKCWLLLTNIRSAWKHTNRQYNIS